MRKCIGFAGNIMNFSYKGYDNQGARVEGAIQSETKGDAKRSLHQQGLFVTSLTKEKNVGFKDNLLGRQHISNKELEYLTSELSLLLNSGITIDKALAILNRYSVSGPRNRLLTGTLDAVRRGESLSNALSTDGQVFTPLYLNLVRLGESTATLPKVFQRLSEDIKFQSQLKEKIIQAMIYPVVIFAVCVLCLIFVLNYIVPEMASLFEGTPRLPLYTSLLLDLSNWMVNYQWWLLLALVLFFLSGLAALRTRSGGRTIDEMILKVPGLRRVIIMTDQIRFTTAIALMLESGILIDRCLDMAIGAVKNNSLKRDLMAAKEKIKKGSTLTEALSSSRLYNDLSISLIEAGEEGGALAQAFQDISLRSRRDFESWISRMTSILEPILILVMGAIVGGIVVIMLLSIVSVNDLGI